MTIPTNASIRGYELRELIGRGGFGDVYRALQPAVGREVAIKVISPQYANDPEFIRCFEVEAHLVARLEHPYIIPLYDYWREPDGAYLVMRYLKAGSLRDGLGHGPWPPQKVLTLAEQTGGALMAAHRQGVIHRDVKPENILLDGDGNAYLTDFGIAKDVDRFTRQSRTGVITGSLAYVSPEQVQSKPVTAASDQYSLGIVLYEALNGAHPFPNETPSGMLLKHLTEPLPALASRVKGLPAGLDEVLRRATAKDPAQRYPDVLALADDFRAALENGPRTTTVVETADVLITTPNPYKGLNAFQEADAPDFFGREALVARLLGRLKEDDLLSRFLAVVGPSGSGKSSVVKAGLLPELRRGGVPGSQSWYMVEMVPGTHPLEELEVGLLRIAVNKSVALMEQLRRDDRGLARAARLALPSEDSTLLLVIDQFEEVFTLVENKAEAAHFLNSLYAAVTSPRSPVRVLITLRADFYDRPLMYPNFSELIRQRTEVVLPLTAEELSRAITAPADRVGARYEAGLVSQIVVDVNDQPGALPLLQYALTELFERRVGRQLTRAAYGAIGGVLGAVRRRAEDVYARMIPEEQEHARQMFLRLVTLGEGVEDTRRRVLRSELESLRAAGASSAGNASMGAVVEAFGQARLLAFDRDPLTRGPTVEVAHEALLSEWKRLREWLDSSRTEVRLQRLLAAAAAEWESFGRDASFLLQGARLAQFEGWSASKQMALTQAEQYYLQASLAERVRQNEEENLRRRQELEAAHRLAETERARAEEQTKAALRLRLRNRLLAGLGLTALVLAVFAGVSALRAETERRLAFSRELAAAAVNEINIDPQVSGLLALQALKIAQTRDAISALHQAVPALHLARNFGGKDYRNVTVSQDGKYIVSFQENVGTIWDLRTGAVLHELPGAADWVFGASFTPDGKYLAAPGKGGTIKIWEVSSGREMKSLPGNGSQVNVVAFSPDGRLLASGGNEAVTRLWDSSSWQLLAALEGHKNTPSTLFPGIFTGVSSVGFVSQSDSLLLASSGFDGLVLFWNLADPAQSRQVFSIQVGTEINWLALSPDGRYAVTSGQNGFTQVWDIAPGPGQGRLSATMKHSSPVNAAAFSPDSKRLADQDVEKTIIVDLETGKTLLSFSGGGNQMVFTPDGRFLAVATGKETQIWDASPDHELLAVECTPPAGSVLYSRDGKRLFIGCGDGSVIFADSSTGQVLLKMKPHTDNVVSMALSPDGTKLATASWDKTAKVLDSSSGKELLQIQAHTDQVWGVAFSPDGKRLATSGFDSQIIIWEVATGKELLRLKQDNPKISTIAFSPDGKRLASGSWLFGEVYIWDLATGKKSMTLSVPGGISHLAFSLDGKRLALAPQNIDPMVWDVSGQEGKNLLTLKGLLLNPLHIAYSPDGSQLATISMNGKTKLWDAASGEELFTMTGRPTMGLFTAFSPNGTRLATSDMDGMVLVYALRLDDLIALAKSRLTRGLDLDECRQFLHTSTCPK